MGHPIDDHFGAQTPAQLFEKHDHEVAASVLRAELRNAKALADKLQTLLDSKTHQVEALYKEAASLHDTLNAANLRADRWQARAEKAEFDLSETAGMLYQHAAPMREIATPQELARHIVARLDPEPDIDTVPLQALLEAVGTFLERDQAVTIRGSFEAVTEVDISAIGQTFRVPTHEASEALTTLQALGCCLLVEAAR